MLSSEISKLKLLKNKKTFLEDDLKKIKKYKEEIELEKEEILQEFNILEESYNELKSILERNNKVFLQNIEDVLSSAIQEIMPDRDYSIKITPSDEKKQLEISFLDNKQEMEVDLDGVGDSVKTIIGVILQIFMIINLDLNKVLIVDEGFSALDINYKETFFDFIKDLISKEDFSIFLVTHDTEILNYATKSLRITNSEDGSYITEVV